MFNLNSGRCAQAVGTTLPYPGAGHISVCYVEGSHGEQLTEAMAAHAGLHGLTGASVLVDKVHVKINNINTVIPLQGIHV